MPSVRQSMTAVTLASASWCGTWRSKTSRGRCITSAVASRDRATAVLTATKHCAGGPARAPQGRLLSHDRAADSIWRR